MTVHDLWKDLSKSEIGQRRQAGRDRWQRRWREGVGREARQRKQSYKEHQKAQAFLDDANQMQNPRAQRIRRESITVGTLLDRHLAAKADRAPKTVETDHHHAHDVRSQFGDRHVSTIDTTEIEVWSQRSDIARSSRKKQLEIFRASIKRGIRDKLIDTDPTEGLVVPLGHKELPHWSSAELMAVIDASANEREKTLLSVLGLMGVRSGEARSLLVGDFSDGRLSVTTSGVESDSTKTRAGRRVLPVPGFVVPLLERQVDNRPKSEWLFPSPRLVGQAVSKGYVSGTVTRAVARANTKRKDPIKRINVHGLRHTFAAMALSEAGADLLSVSRAMGHARPSITLDKYGHLAPAGLAPLMDKIDQLAQARS